MQGAEDGLHTGCWHCRPKVLLSVTAGPGYVRGDAPSNAGADAGFAGAVKSYSAATVVELADLASVRFKC